MRKSQTSIETWLKAINTVIATDCPCSERNAAAVSAAKGAILMRLIEISGIPMQEILKHRSTHDGNDQQG